MIEFFGGICRVIKREIYCVIVGGGIWNVLMCLNIFEMKIYNDCFLVVIRELIILGIVNFKMC